MWPSDGTNDHVAAVPPSPPLGPPRGAYFSPETEAAVTAGAPLHENGHAIDEHGCRFQKCGGSSKDETGVGEHHLVSHRQLQIDLDGLANRSPNRPSRPRYALRPNTELFPQPGVLHRGV